MLDRRFSLCNSDSLEEPLIKISFAGWLMHSPEMEQCHIHHSGIK